MSTSFVYCPKCAASLSIQQRAGRDRQVCSAPGCGFVHWGNPTPVVAALVEHEGQVLLVRSKGWPEKMYALVAGFLEADETPEAGVLREVKEELGLDGEVVRLIGLYPFELKNELIIAYHVRARGVVTLGEELEAFKPLAPEKVRPWPMGTGLAVRDWLEAWMAGQR